MGIDGSSPCEYSAVIRARLLTSSNRINRATPWAESGLLARGRGLSAARDVTHGSRIGGDQRFAVDRFVDRLTRAVGAIRSGRRRRPPSGNAR